MKKDTYVIVLEQNEAGLNALFVVDPNKVLPNGKNEVIKVLIGDYADEIAKELGIIE